MFKQYKTKDISESVLQIFRLAQKLYYFFFEKFKQITLNSFEMQIKIDSFKSNLLN